MAFLQSEYNRNSINVSQQEMLDISQTINRDFSPRFAKQTRQDAPCAKSASFSARELLSISQEISREFAARLNPGRPNLVLLPIAPRHLHAYWRLDGNKFDHAAPITGQKLTLRIFNQANSQLEKNANTQAIEIAMQPNWLDIAVDTGKTSMDVTLPSEHQDIKSYSAAIGAIHAGQIFMPVVYSNQAETPNPQAQTRPKSDNSRLSAAVLQSIMPETNQPFSSSSVSFTKI